MIVLEQQGAVIRAYNPDYCPPKGPKSAKRGKVTGFSKKSRRRLMILLNRMDYKATRVAFITLTFGGTPTHEAAKAAFKRFRTALGRKYPTAAAVWRVELQKRGVAHFHLLVFGLPYVEQSDLQKFWESCTRESRSIVHIKGLTGRRKVIHYLSKYIAKPEDADRTTSLELSPYQHNPVLPWLGRVWGIINEPGLPLAELHQVVIVDEDLQQQLWLAAQVVSGGKCGHNGEVVMIFSDFAEEWFEMARARGKLVVDVSGQKTYNVELVDRE